MTETNGQRKQTLREWREESRLSQRDLGELAGFSPAAISDYERGRLRLWGMNARKIAEVLGIESGQIVRINIADAIGEIDTSWWEDGFSDAAPVLGLRDWRERRSLSQTELGALSGVGAATISGLENGKYKSTTAVVRRKLLSALKLRADKLVLSGDNLAPTQYRDVQDVLRAELRGARYALRIAFDFMREDYKIASRYLDERDKALEVVMREMRGT